MFELANTFQNESRRHARVLMLRRFDLAELVHREKEVRKPCFNDDGKVKTRFPGPVNFALESLPSVSDRPEEIVERLPFDSEPRITFDAIISGADCAAMDLDPRRVEVPGRLLACIYGYFEHNNAR